MLILYCRRQRHCQAAPPPRPKGLPMLFSRWGGFAYRFRRPIVLVTVLFAIASAVIGARVTSALSAGGWVDPTSESFAVSTRLNDEFGAGRGTLIVLYQGEPGSDAPSATVQGGIPPALARPAQGSRVWGLSGFV